MIVFVIILILSVGIGFLAVHVIKSLIVPKKIDGIAKLIQQGKLTAAIKIAKGFISKNPRDAEAHYLLGKAYLVDKKPELALMEFKIVNQNALFGKIIPEIEFRNIIAQLFIKYNQGEEALKEYLMLTKLQPTNPDHFYNVGVLFEQRERMDQAFNYYSKTIELNKKHINAHIALGQLFYKTKHFAEAKKEFDQAIALKPESFSAYFYIGKILKENRDYASAVTFFEKSMRSTEFKQKSMLERGSCFMAANNTEKAIPEFDRAIRASQDEGDSDTLYARYFLAACYEKNRDIDKAVEQWEKIYAKKHNFSDVAAKLAQNKELQANDHMKEYLTSSSGEFVSICQSLAEEKLSLIARDIKETKFGCKMLASEQAKAENWMSQRQQQHILLFYRETDLVEDSILRSLIEEIKKINASRAIVFSSAGFTRSAIEFVEGRPLELVGKEKLDIMLSSLSIFK